MKYLLLLILLGLIAFIIGFKRARPPTGASKAPAPLPTEAMASCEQCGLHLPLDETLPGRNGRFCSAAHREAFEAEHGGRP
jgi:uncharacterized protein